MFKLATWNVNSLNVRWPHVLNWIEENKPDVVALQELKIPIEKIPFSNFQEIGYNILANAQKTYNGVAIITNSQIEEPLLDMPHFIDEQKRVIAATINGYRVINFMSKWRIY